MATTTTALLLNETNGPFSLDEVSIGPINEDEVLVEIHATGICHTDLSCADGTLPAAVPAVFGHEGKMTTLSICLRLSCFSQLEENEMCKH
jgi:Zn-dependent alcohol dehydrogenase